MEHPYRNRPAAAFWRAAVAEAEEVDPVPPLAVRIGQRDAVATAGSCFAQHLARHLLATGRTVLRTEPPLPGAGEEHALFPANFGNIYTARHLLRLFEEAFGLREPRALVWRRPDGRCADGLRPRLPAQGFDDAAAVHAARTVHLAAVREMFERCDVFAFTLGLAEAWLDPRDGTAFPLAPGIVAVPEDGAEIGIHAFSAAEVQADLERFLDGLAEVNPGARCLLTVSPVPLAATATEHHVLVASTLGKATLRVAADAAARRPGVAYFPAYEIVQAMHLRGRGFAPDLRSVAPEAVARVMALFDRHAVGDAPAPRAPEAPRAAPGDPAGGDAAAAHAALREVVCDEDLLDPGGV
jgi:hypothetical protein